jgi:MFS family permease
MLSLARQPGFALLWTAGLVSQIGDWLLVFSLPLYVYQQTGSSLATGATFAAGLLPRIAIGSLAGVLVDRWDRRRTMIAADLLRAALLPLLLLVQSPDWLWLVYVVAVAETALAMFFEPANSALRPTIIAAGAPPERLTERLVSGNAAFAQRGAIVRLVGPPLGGALLGLFGLPFLALLDSASFLISAALIALIRVPAATQDATLSGARTAAQRAGLWLQMWREWLAGLRLVRRHPLLSGFFTVEAVRTLADGIVGASIVIFVTQVLHGDGQTLGWWVTANAIGGLVGGALIGRLGERVRPTTWFGVGLVISGMLALVRTNAAGLPEVVAYVPVLALVLVVNGLVGACAAGMQVGHQTLLQSTVADKFRGRVFGALNALHALMMLVGAGLAGILGDQLGVVTLFNLMSGLYVLSGVLALVLLRRAAPEQQPTLQFAMQPVRPPHPGAVLTARAAHYRRYVAARRYR